MLPKFLEGLDRDIQDTLKAQLRNLWTHHSTAIEGNSLSLGETAFVLEEGLTIAGKPLKDHHEVLGHARAIELIFDLVTQDHGLTESKLFDLHKAVQTSLITDVYKPIGAWKIEPNGTYTVNASGQQIFIEFTKPADVPALMAEWLLQFNQYLAQPGQSQEACLKQYVDLHVAFVRIHPFFDGNGRMARLLSNVPILKAGWPPIVIPKESRMEYIRSLAAYELAAFYAVCQKAWQSSHDLVAAARVQQQTRVK